MELLLGVICVLLIGKLLIWFHHPTIPWALTLVVVGGLILYTIISTILSTIVQAVGGWPWFIVPLLIVIVALVVLALRHYRLGNPHLPDW